MDDDNASPPEVLKHLSNKSLGPIARLLVAIPATLLGLAGIAAVYLTDNEVGTAALIIVGGLFGAVTVLGYWPRIRVADTEFDPRLAEYFERVGVRQGAQGMAVKVFEEELTQRPSRSSATEGSRAQHGGPMAQTGTDERSSSERAARLRELLAAARDVEGESLNSRASKLGMTPVMYLTLLQRQTKLEADLGADLEALAAVQPSDEYQRNFLENRIKDKAQELEAVRERLDAAPI